MPSAQKKGVGEPLTNNGRDRDDFHVLLHALRASNVTHLNSLHSRGKTLFEEGEPAQGIYLLRSGRAAVSISSSEGRVVTLRLAYAGDVLGLNSVLRDGFYDTTVKTLEPCRTDFIARTELIDVMQRSQAGAQTILNILSRELTELTDRAKLLLLPQTVRGRFAKLLLEWARENGSDADGEILLDKVFTHEEIAQMIYSSRETVTRLFADFKRRNVIHVASDGIVIQDCIALEKLALG